MADSIPHAFLKQLEEMFENVQVLYPDCDKVRAVRKEFNVLKRMGPAMLIRAWHDNMGPFYADCTGRNAHAIAKGDLPILHRFGFSEKLADPLIDDETRRTMWEYIDVLNLMALQHFKEDEKYAWYYQRIQPTEIDTADTDAQTDDILKKTLGMDMLAIQGAIPPNIFNSIKAQIEALSDDALGNMDITDPRFLKTLMDINARAVAGASQAEREALETSSKRLKLGAESRLEANPHILQDLQKSLGKPRKRAPGRR